MNRTTRYPILGLLAAFAGACTPLPPQLRMEREAIRWVGAGTGGAVSSSTLASLDCRAWCKTAPEPARAACLRTVEERLHRLGRFYNERLLYTQTAAWSFCLAAHQDEMLAAGVKLEEPAGECRVRELLESISVTREQWMRECGEAPYDPYKCDRVPGLSLGKMQYLMVLPVYDGPGCPAPIPPREAERLIPRELRILE